MGRLITLAELVPTISATLNHRHVNTSGSRPRTVLVGIDGLGGSGKTTLAHEIVAALRDLGLSADIISIDDFSHRNTPTWDDALFRRQVLPHLEPPTEFTYDVNTWDSLNPVGQRTVSACDVLVVEGVSVLHPRSGAPWDVTIWVETPAPVRRARLQERDGAALAEVWEQQWLPSELNYVAECDPKSRVDFIIESS